MKDYWMGLALILVSGLLQASEASPRQLLKPFTSDGCSAFPDGTLQQKNLWLDCCTKHDLAYWQGGTKAQRKLADKSLEACVAKVGEPKIAKLMLAGVRVGGSPYWPTPFRWGYGWPYPKEYGELTADEKQQVKLQFKRWHSAQENSKITAKEQAADKD